MWLWVLYMTVHVCLCGMCILEHGSTYVFVSAHVCVLKCLGVDRDSGRAALHLCTQVSEQPGHGSDPKDGRWEEEAGLEAWMEVEGAGIGVLASAHKNNSPRQR